MNVVMFLQGKHRRKKVLFGIILFAVCLDSRGKVLRLRMQVSFVIVQLIVIP